MKKAGFIAVLSLLLLAQPVLARSGCCSHHGGVRADGCGCNDGTPLSSTCAPYYACTATEPVVNLYPTSTPYPTQSPIFKPTANPRPTRFPTKQPTVTATPTNTPTPTVVSPTPTSEPITRKAEGMQDKTQQQKTFLESFMDSVMKIMLPQFGFFSLFEN